MEQKIFKGSELQFRDINNGNKWLDCQHHEYRIKPKTVKFRNYLTTQDLPGVVFENHPESMEPLMFKRWLGDWQEVEIPEQQEKWPSELVARIAKIDLQAAEWLRDNWDDRIMKSCQSATRLVQIMSWGETPQGYSYWRDISNKLGE